MLMATAFRYMVPLVASGTIDFALGSGNGTSRVVDFMERFVVRDWLAGHLWAAGLVMVGLTASAGLFNFFKGKLAAEASDGIARRLKNRLYDHLQRLPMRFHDQAETGDLVQRCTSDVETLRLAISTQVVEVSHALILMGTALPLMFLLDSRMAVASFVLIGPIILFGYFYIKRVRRLFQKFDEAEGKVTAIVQENLTGLRVVRAFRRQDYELEKFSHPNKEYRDLGLRLIRLMAAYWSISDLVALSQNAIVLGLGVHFISQGSLTVGTLFAFIMLLNLVLWPVRQMGRTLTELGKSFVSIGRIQEILGAGKTFSKPDDFSLADHLMGAFGVFCGEGEFRVRIEFDPFAAQLVRERNWHSSQALRDLPGDCLELDLQLDSLEEIERWVLSWGSHARVLAPTALKKRVQAAVKDMDTLYRDAPPWLVELHEAAQAQQPDRVIQMVMSMNRVDHPGQLNLGLEPSEAMN